MEYLLQYLDDLDDLYGVVGLVWEKFRRALLKLTSRVMVRRCGGRLASRLRSRIRPSPWLHPPCCS